MLRNLMFAAIGMIAASSLTAAKADDANLGAIRALATTYQDAYNARNADALAALFTADCVYMADHATATVGHDAVAALFRAEFDPGAKFYNLDIVVNQVVVAGDYASARGTDTLAGNGNVEGVPMTGKWLATYRRENGAWKILWSTFNSNQ